MMMADKSLNVDQKEHELKLGQSFDQRPKVAFHSLWCDFKPASTDVTKKGLVKIGDKVENGNSEVTVTLPSQGGHGKSRTVYKGKKMPVQKECVLVIDHQTGTFTLEKFSDTIRVKKTRDIDSSRGQPGGHALTSVEMAKSRYTSSPPRTKVSNGSASKSSVPKTSPSLSSTDAGGVSPIGHISDSSSEDSSDSQSDSDDASRADSPLNNSASAALQQYNILTSDLQLSEESSDSD